MVRVSCGTMGMGSIPASARRAAADPDLDELQRPAPRRGRPRSEEADRNILRAATEVLAERGLSGMSIEEVASRAGVAKATIYRRWSSKGTLALDAFLAELRPEVPPADTGTLRGDLERALQGWVRSLTMTSAGSMLAGLMDEARQDAELAGLWRERVAEPIRTQYTAIIERAIARGDIPADTDEHVVLDLLFGSAAYRLIRDDHPLDDNFVQRVVAILSAGLTARVG
jgi:AcrR family transcriptional regulator